MKPKISGVKPKPRSPRTICCVGLVFYTVRELAKRLNKRCRFNITSRIEFIPLSFKAIEIVRLLTELALE